MLTQTVFATVMLLVCAEPTTRPAMPMWLVGEWGEESASGKTLETWTEENGVMEASSQRIRDGKVVFTESLKISVSADGILNYVATPQGEAETTFKAVESREGFIAFENPAHDFPTRITYRADGTDTVVAEISGKRGGTEVSRKWTYRRIKATTRPGT